MRDIVDFCIEVMLPMLAIAAAAGVFILGIVVTVSYLDCRGFRNGTGIEARWEWGCYVKHEGEWVPKEYYFGQVLEHRIKDKR